MNVRKRTYEYPFNLFLWRVERFAVGEFEDTVQIHESLHTQKVPRHLVPGRSSVRQEEEG